MEDKDLFKSWLKKSLEEETKDINFSAEAREKVKQIVFFKEAEDPVQPVNKNNHFRLLKEWWNRPIAISARLISICVIVLFFVTAFYTGTFFYISEEEIAKLEMREKIILNEGGVPFGAVQHFMIALEKGKGVTRP